MQPVWLQDTNELQNESYCPFIDLWPTLQEKCLPKKQSLPFSEDNIVNALPCPSYFTWSYGMYKLIKLLIA